MSLTEPLRGEVFEIDLGFGPKPYVVVSNNIRNRVLDDVVVARITTSPNKPDIPSIVELTRQDRPLTGRVLGDDLATVPKSEFLRTMGSLSRETMERADDGLRSALNLA